MKAGMNRHLLPIVVFLLLLIASSLSVAQNRSTGTAEPLVSTTPTSCFTQGENVGQHIIEYVLCGASLTNQQDTLQGALLLILCTICLGVSLFMMSWNGLKYIFFTMQKGVPGGDKVLGGIVVLRSALLVSFLVPIISNGYAPVNVLMRSITELGASFGDAGAVAGSYFLDNHDGYTASGVTGVSAVSQQIILSTLCAQNFEIYNNESLVQTDTYHIQKRIFPSGGTVRIRWDLVEGESNTGYSNVVPGVSYSDKNGICGEIEFHLHTYLTKLLDDTVSVSGSTITFNGLNTSQQVYERPAKDQFAALIQHIADVEQILADASDDLKAGVKATAIRSTMDSSRIGESEDLIAQSEDGIHSSNERMRELTADLINSSLDYERAVIRAGDDAAQRVRETDTAYGCLPTGPVDSSIFNSVAYERPDLHLTECEAGGETWADKIAIQGFLVLPLYYTSILEVNQRILAIQKHYATADVEAELYNDKQSEWFDTKVAFHIQQGEEAYARLASRTNSILMMFKNSRPSTEFYMDFSIAENSRVTVAEVQDDSRLGKINKAISKAGQFLTRTLTDYIRQFAENGDIVLTLINIGTGIISIAEFLIVGLLGLMAVGGIAKLFLMIPRIATKAKDIASSVSKGKKNVGAGDENSSGIGNLFWIVLGFVILGGMLMYGLPFIVLFKWLLEMQSWAIMMLIAQIYAPLWIMAHASITDERFMHEHTLSGYGLLFELTLRPLLLVISFFSVLILMYIAGLAMKFVASAMMGVASGGTNGLLGLVIITFLVFYAALQLVFRTFDLISIMTDKVLTRFSFGSSPLGDVSQDKTHSSFGAFIQRQATSPHGVGNKIATNVGQKLGFIPTKKT